MILELIKCCVQLVFKRFCTSLTIAKLIPEYGGTLSFGCVRGEIAGDRYTVLQTSQYQHPLMQVDWIWMYFCVD